MTTAISQLYAIDTADFSDVTDSGVGILRRTPRLTPHQLAIVRWRLDNGSCLAAFDAGIHAVRDAIHHTISRIHLVQTDDLEALPGLRP